MGFVFDSDGEKVTAAFSGRGLGNMSLSYGDTSASLNNRKKFLAGLGIDHKSLVCAKQVHSGNVVCVGPGHRGRGAVCFADALEACDGLVTAEKNLPLAIFTADCLSVFIYDPQTPAIGLVHAGWRGSWENIVASGVGLMRREFGSRTAELRAGFGPAIRVCCYEVGGDFRDKFSSGFIEINGRAYLDLAAVNTKQLLDEGLAPENIFSAQGCTNCHDDDFFSFRREKDACGRMISVIMLK